MPNVYVLNGPEANLPCGVFSTKDLAEKAIKHHRLSGTLTEFPLDRLAYSYAIEFGSFVPKTPRHSEASFIEQFSNASDAHWHYEKGHLTGAK